MEDEWLSKKEKTRWKQHKISELGLKVLELRAKGKSLNEISTTLKVSNPNAARALAVFREQYAEIKRIVEEVEDKDLWRKGFTDWSRELSKSIKSRMQAGFYWGPAPFGYHSLNGLLEIVPGEAEVVERLFELRKEGKSTGEIAKLVGKNKFQVREMLRNPVYKGVIQYHGDLIHGKHKAIVSEELWETCQPLTAGPWSGGVPPFGYKWHRGLLVRDPEKASIVERVFDMRLQGKTIHEISTAVGIGHTPVQKMLKSPYVCGKKYDSQRKTIDVDWEPIIPYSKWLAARGIRRKEEWYVRTAEINVARGHEADNLVKKELPATRVDIVRRIASRSPSCVRMHIQQLLKKGEIEEQPDGLLILRTS